MSVPPVDLQKMELLGLNVRDIDAAIELFSGLFGIEFVRFEFTEDVPIERLPSDGSDAQALSSSGTIVAMDRTGCVELIQTSPPVDDEGMRNIHFKVSDIDAAVAHLRSQGFRVVANMRIGGLREAAPRDADVPGRVRRAEHDRGDDDVRPASALVPVARVRAGHRPRSRAISSFMISFVPAQILVTRASRHARATRYSFMYP